MGRSITTTTGSGAVKSIQKGFVNAVTPSTGTGDDVTYYNVTITSVDTTKSVVMVEAGEGNSAENSVYYSQMIRVFGRLTSSTNLRLHTPATNLGKLTASWTVIEYY